MAFYIRPRKAWKARAAKNRATIFNWADGVDVVVHHTADTFRGGSVAAEIDHLQSMQYFHQVVRDWSDIGYNYIIMPSGRVWEGRGFGARGSHVLNHNSDACGISFAGDYSKREPTAAAQLAYKQLLERLKLHGARVRSIKAHGDLMATACPGRGVRSALGLGA